MNKKPLKARITAVMTAILTMTAMCLPAAAFASSSGVTKEETVYVVTDSSGTQQDVIVSDHLINKDKIKTISDETTLSDIENVKGEETFKQDGDALTWDAEGNGIYYQGKSSDEIPVSMDVVYRLDDKVVSGPELQGKSGKVEIKINYENDAEYEGTTVPFVVMTGLIVTDDSFKNIKISKGKVIDDGEKLLVVGMAAPGLAQTLGIGESDLGIGSSVTITGDAEKFAVEDMMTIVTNAFFEDIDADSIDDLDYDDEIKQLDKGAKALADGSDQLYKGLDALSDKMPDLQSGVKKLKDGSDALKSGSKELHDELGKIKDVVTLLDKGMEEAAGKLNQAAALNNHAISDIAELEGQITLIENELDVYLNTDTVPPEVKTKIGELKARLTAMKTALGNPQPHQFDPTAPSSITEEIMVSSSIDKGVATSMTTNGTDQNHTMLDAVEGLETGLGSDTTNKTLLNGSAQVEGGAKQLADGLTTLYNSSGTMSNGVYQLGDGAYKLRNGMSKLYKQGIKKIVDMYNDELKGTLNDARCMLDAGKGYKTFTKLPSDMDGNVKFIYKTDMTE